MNTLVVNPRDIGWAMRAARKRDSLSVAMAKAFGHEPPTGQLAGQVDAVVCDPWYDGEPAIDAYGGAELPLAVMS